jgi:hypothetical protein
MAKRQRIDSITAAVKVMQKAATELFPPDHILMTRADMPFWSSVLHEKAMSEWTSHDLELAALLAKSLRKMEQEDILIDKEGSVVLTGAGTPMANPRVRIAADLHSRIMKYRQTLGIHARGKGGEARDVEKRRERAREIEGNNPLADDLLARPSLQ